MPQSQRNKNHKKATTASLQQSMRSPANLKCSKSQSLPPKGAASCGLAASRSCHGLGRAGRVFGRVGGRGTGVFFLWSLAWRLWGLEFGHLAFLLERPRVSPERGRGPIKGHVQREGRGAAGRCDFRFPNSARRCPLPATCLAPGRLLGSIGCRQTGMLALTSASPLPEQTLDSHDLMFCFQASRRIHIR